jgi:5-carboxyvanillate decarboxylase
MTLNTEEAPQAELATGGAQGYLRIATEEAYAPPEMFELYRKLLRDGTNENIGFNVFEGYLLNNTDPWPRSIVERIQDLGERRLADMDATGIDHQILSLTSPGTQVLGVEDAKRIATIANDNIAQACRDHPTRYSGLAAVGFDDADSAVAELHRAITGLGLKGLICNSHINGNYLDDPRYFPILEALQDLDVPLYLHPNLPNNRMIGPLTEAGLDGAIFGFGVETGMHLLRIITSGLLDRLPRLKIVVGHLGEALPFWLSRIDFMHAGQVRTKRYEAIKPLELAPSEYFKRNIWLTTSGMAWEPAITFSRNAVGADRVMYAMDYPYQYQADEVRTQDALPYSAAEKKAFFETIARDVFKLDTI